MSTPALRAFWFDQFNAGTEAAKASYDDAPDLLGQMFGAVCNHCAARRHTRCCRANFRGVRVMCSCGADGHKRERHT